MERNQLLLHHLHSQHQMQSPRWDQRTLLLTLYCMLQVVYDFSWRQPSTGSDQPRSSDTAASSAVAAAPAQSASDAMTPSGSAYPIAALPHNVQQAISALSDGQVIAVPTDTLYGLAADANSSAGIQRIYSIKNRQAHAPLAICIADVDNLHRYWLIATIIIIVIVIVNSC